MQRDWPSHVQNQYKVNEIVVNRSRKKNKNNKTFQFCEFLAHKPRGRRHVSMRMRLLVCVRVCRCVCVRVFMCVFINVGVCLCVCECLHLRVRERKWERNCSTVCISAGPWIGKPGERRRKVILEKFSKPILNYNCKNPEPPQNRPIYYLFFEFVNCNRSSSRVRLIERRSRAFMDIDVQQYLSINRTVH